MGCFEIWGAVSAAQCRGVQEKHVPVHYHGLVGAGPHDPSKPQSQLKDARRAVHERKSQKLRQDEAHCKLGIITNPFLPDEMD